MSISIFTSMFPDGIKNDTAEMLDKKIKKRERFVFVASEFCKIHEKTDRYFHIFLGMLKDIGIEFSHSCVLDGRMSIDEARMAVEKADVIWLAGGDTPTQFGYLKDYGLVDLLKDHKGVVIGMSAGSINMAKTAICTLSCGHSEQIIYEGIGRAEVSVEPHFDIANVSEELLELSEKYVIYGLPDDGVIAVTDGNVEFFGEVYELKNREIRKVTV